MKEESIYWILEKTLNERFPYRLSIRQADENYIILRTQHHWPGTKGNIFCLRETTFDPDEELVEIERVRVTSFKQFGKRLSISLDRPVKKRCDFLFLKKRYKNNEKEYEQIFWQTQKGLSEKRPKVRFVSKGKITHKIVIDPNERYEWTFAGFKTVKGNLPVGDYAVLVGSDLKAIVERKTYDNMVRDFSDMQILHQKLSEMESYPNAALVIEASYSDFLKPKRMIFPITYISKAFAEISAFHPKITMIFAQSRKLANEWCKAYFLEVGNISNESNKILKYHTLDTSQEYKEGLKFFEVRKKVLSSCPSPFNIKDLSSFFPREDMKEIKKYLRTMVKWEDLKRGEVKGKYMDWLIV